MSMRDRQTLLAKSIQSGREVGLADHMGTVCEAARHLFGSPEEPTHLGREWLRFFRLDADRFSRFQFNVLLASALHDLGKANDGFQAEVRGQRGAQAIRHEHLAALLLHRPELRQWLGAHPLVDYEVAVSAVVSHHLKVTDQDAPPGYRFASRMRDASGVRVLADSSGFADALGVAAALLDTPAPTLPAECTRWTFDRTAPCSIPESAEQFRHEFHRFERQVRGDDQRFRLLLAVRPAVVASDALGSALVRTAGDLDAWVSDAFAAPLTAEDIDAKVLQPRIEEIKRNIKRKRRHATFTFHAFQTAAGQLGSRALLLSGCGTGKTLAAWLWIRAQIARRPASRVLFLYPTRGTATEGFRDYASWAGSEAALIHGTARYVIEGLFTNPDDERRKDDYRVDPRLFALGYWPRRVVSATVDAFLGFMSNAYGPICLLPMLVDSVVVVDEVHSFDPLMFRALVRFLQFFDCPVLCMTASLTEDRIGALRDVGLEVFPPSADAFEDLRRIASRPRYRIGKVASSEAAEARVLRDVRGSRKKVLWVVNTVARCQDVARKLSSELGPSVTLLCYHSRFRLDDRNRLHEVVIGRFREPGPIVLVSTQVCEMSLDLDADVLVTEVAPVPSLVQRMGRCCREPSPPSDRMGEVWVYAPGDPKPYEKAEVDQAEALVQRWNGRDLSQQDLSSDLAEMEVLDPVLVSGYTSFLDSGWWAWSREQSFREGDEYTVQAVLDSDLAEFIANRRAHEPNDGLLVPVPRSSAQFDEGHGVFVAPGAQYDSALGFVKERSRP